MVLPRHRAEPAHLPERPLNRVVTAVDIGRQEFSGLLREIQQHRAGFEDRDRLAAALRFMIDHRGNAVVRRDRQKLRLELVALADIDRENLVFEPGLFEKHRDLVAVRRGPVMKVNHGAFLSCFRVPTGTANWMRLHEVHRIAPAKSIAPRQIDLRKGNMTDALRDQLTRPCSRKNFLPPSVIATLTPIPATDWRAT